MKTTLKVFVLLFLFLSSAFYGWNSNDKQTTDITNYYYYNGIRYYLNHNPDMVYIKLKNVVSRDEFNTIISSFGEIPPDFSFEKSDVRQMVKLRGRLDNNSLSNLISIVAGNPLVEYASPVFTMLPGLGNDNTLIGCENNIIVQFKPAYSKEQINQYLSERGMKIQQELELTGGLSFIIQIPFLNNKTSIDFANEVYSSGMANFSDPGFMFTNLLQYIPNDQFFPMQWSAINTGTNIPVTGNGTPDCDMGLDTAWNQTLGNAQVRVSIVDSGIDTTHPDFAANVLHGYNFNYYNNTYGGYDDYGHGASTAGIVGAIGNNSIGISGVCPIVRVFSAKIFNAAGSTTTTAIINGLIGVRTFGNCWISSNSWGGGSPISAANQAIDDGVTLGRNGKGIVWSFATGNGNSSLSWPSTHASVISVGGNSPCNQRKSPSSCDLENFWGANYGTGLDIVAPCVKIYATVQGGGYTSTFNGTSSATPNCSGVAALLLSKDSNQTWDTVRQRIDRTALKKGTYSYTSVGPLTNLGAVWNNEMGYGIINANLALLTVGPPPVNDVAVGPFLSFPPQFVLGTNYPIKARFSNLGTNAQTNVPTRFSVDGLLVSSGTIANLPPGSNDSASFAWTPTVVGSHTLRIYSGLAVDQNRSNDTVTAVINVLPAGTVINQQQICRNGLNIPIPQQGNAPPDTILVNIPNSFNVTDVNVRIDTVTHTWDSDLQFNLSHLGTTVTFINSVGGSGDNFILCVLNDSAATPISNGTAPFTGTWRPSSPLAPFNNNPVNGAWILQIVDQFAGDSGYLKAWCIQVCYQTLLGGIETLEIPSYYSLSQNYPNPFNPMTLIKYGIPKPANVTLTIYDLLGREVKTLVNERKNPGFYNVEFDGTNLASGIYLYRISVRQDGSSTDNFIQTRKMLLIK